MKRVNAYFSLQQWEQLIDAKHKDDYYFPAGVKVRDLDSGFQVTTYIKLDHTKLNLQDKLIKVFERARKAQNPVPPKRRDKWLPLYEKVLASEDAVQEVLLRMNELRSSLSELIT